MTTLQPQEPIRCQNPNCPNEFQPAQPWSKYCSPVCSKEHQRLRLLGDDQPKMNTCTIGAISELVVSADLMLRGFEVFRALSPGAFCDLVAIDRQRNKYTIQVRTGTVSSAGKLHYVDSGEYDILAIVVYGQEVIYLPEFPT